MNLEKLRQDVRDIDSTIEAAVVFIGGLVEQLHTALAGPDLQSDVESLAAELEEHQVKLATAIAANTASENDSANVEPDHGPIDDSQVTPPDGSPTVDPTVGTTPATDSNAGAAPASDTTTDTSVDSNTSTDQPAPGEVPADNTTISEPPVSGNDSVAPAPADEPGVAADDTTTGTPEADPNQGQLDGQPPQ